MAATETYTLEQAEEDLAALRGQVEVMGEHQTVGGITIDGVANQITVDTWHAMTLLNSWTNRGTGFANAQYRLLASPPNSVEVIGEISHASITGNSQIWTAPAGYVPANSQALMGSDPVSNGQLFINASGALSVFGLSSTTVVQFHGIYSLDA